MQVLSIALSRAWLLAVLAAISAAAILPALLRSGVSAPVTPRVPAPQELDAPNTGPFVPVPAAPLPATSAAPTLPPAVQPQTSTDPTQRPTAPALAAPLAPEPMPQSIATPAPSASPSTERAGNGPAVFDPADQLNASDAGVSLQPPAAQTTLPGKPVPRG